MDILTFALMLGAFALIISIRNNLVFNARMRAINLTSKRSLAAVNLEEARGEWQRFKEHQSYFAMMFDLTKWTFNQFYPWLGDAE